MGEGFGESRDWAEQKQRRTLWSEGRPGDGVVASEGVSWTPAHNDAGSRRNGWQLLQERLENVVKPERLRLFVFNTCRQFIRTVPVLLRGEIDWLRSRTGRRFPCGTKSIGIMTEYS